MRTRWSAYAGVSAALAGGVIVKALAQRPNFYSATVYLSQSSANVMILANFIFVAACTILLGLQKLLYGTLRPIEVEQLYEKAWFAVTETCLAMTIFRGEIGPRFLVMFFALLAGKVWTWIGEGRVEVLEQQPPQNPRMFHTRLALSLGLSVLFDLTMLEYVVRRVMNMPKPDMMVMFGFEFAVLSIVSLSTASRYAINLTEIAIVRSQKARQIDEIRREAVATAMREAEQPAQQDDASATGQLTNASVVQATEAARRALQQPIDDTEIEVEGWEGKGRWIFYLDLATDFFKLIVYLSFFFILLIFYGLPIHILRDVFMTFRSFFKRIGDFVRYRTATRDMNQRYPDATEQEIRSDDVCIICREEMRPYQPPADGARVNPVAERMRPKKLPCGHILHFSCLRSWLERQQICPTCRTNVVTRNPVRTGNNAGQADGVEGQHGNAAAPAERQGPRVYQWGPLRIGIGAARGNMLEDLQQQLGDGQQGQAQQPPADGPQQYGFGIRWDGLRRRDRDRDRDRGERNSRGIQHQLEDVQRQISQEYRSLGLMTHELRLLRNMELELNRVRAVRQERTAPPTGSIQSPAFVYQGGNDNRNSTPTFTALATNPQNTIPAGSNQLPAGLTLPEGWTMVPLHPVQPDTQLTMGLPFNGNAPGFPSGLPGMPIALPLPNNMLHNPLFPGAHSVQQATWTNQARYPVSHPVVNMAQPTHSDLPQQQAATSGTGESNGIRANQLGGPTALDQQPTHDVQTEGSATPLQNSAGPRALQPDGQVAEPWQPQPQPPVSQSYLNGSASQHTTPNQPMGRDNSVEHPVASMFTLPSWGSVPMAASTSNRVPTNLSETGAEHETSSGVVTSNSEPASQGQDDTPAASVAKSKNPTVEDLVEEPD